MKLKSLSFNSYKKLQLFYITLSSYNINYHHHYREFHNHNLNEYVPSHKRASLKDIETLQRFVSESKSILILTGAGISTESGIPDYRSESVGLYARSGHKPVQYNDFIKSESIRRRYWARNYLGFNRWSSFEPNIGHHTLRSWECLGKINTIVTQNVDRLHQKAGSERVIELHGNGYIVKCLNCKYHIKRIQLQQLLNNLNSHLIELNNNQLFNNHQLRPDGDIDINSDFVKNFQFPDCPNCKGILKPDIIFFGDNVPKNRVDMIYDKLSQSDSLLIIGSSLHVYSGYRFAYAAAEAKKAIALLNIGPSRIDQFNGIIKLNARAGDVLPQIIVK